MVMAPAEIAGTAKAAAARTATSARLLRRIEASPLGVAPGPSRCTPLHDPPAMRLQDLLGEICHRTGKDAAATCRRRDRLPPYPSGGQTPMPMPHRGTSSQTG